MRTVDRLQQCLTYDVQLRTYYSLTAKRAALLESKPQAEREASDAFRSLEQEIAAVRESLDGITERFDTGDFERAFRDIERPAETTTVE